MVCWTFLFLVGCSMVAGSYVTESDEELISDLADPEDRSIARNIITAIKMMDSGESDEENEFGMNPRNLMDKVSGSCDCQGSNNCGCCGKVEVIGSAKMKLCGNVSVVPSEYAFQVAARVGKFNVLKTKISAKKLERVCDRLPWPLKTVKICLKSTMQQLDDENSFHSCMLIDIQVNQKVLTTFKFKCLRYENGQLTFTGRTEDDTGATATIKAPNPIKTVIDLIKKD